MQRIAEYAPKSKTVNFGVCYVHGKGGPNDKCLIFIIDCDAPLKNEVQVDEKWEVEEVSRTQTKSRDCYGVPIWLVFVRPISRVEEPSRLYFDRDTGDFAVIYRSGHVEGVREEHYPGEEKTIISRGYVEKKRTFSIAVLWGSGRLSAEVTVATFGYGDYPQEFFQQFGTEAVDWWAKYQEGQRKWRDRLGQEEKELNEFQEWAKAESRQLIDGKTGDILAVAGEAVFQKPVTKQMATDEEDPGENGVKLGVLGIVAGDYGIIVMYSVGSNDHDGGGWMDRLSIHQVEDRQGNILDQTDASEEFGACDALRDVLEDVWFGPNPSLIRWADQELGALLEDKCRKLWDFCMENHFFHIERYRDYHRRGGITWHQTYMTENPDAEQTAKRLVADHVEKIPIGDHQCDLVGDKFTAHLRWRVEITEEKVELVTADKDVFGRHHSEASRKPASYHGTVSVRIADFSVTIDGDREIRPDLIAAISIG